MSSLFPDVIGFLHHSLGKEKHEKDIEREIM